MAKNADHEGPAGAGGGKSRADQLRAAVEGAFGATAQGTAPVQKRAQDLADELVGAASRVRDVLEDLRPPSPEELDGLRAQIDALERRVAELEGAAAAAAKPKAKRAAAKPRAATRTSKPKPKPKRS